MSRFEAEQVSPEIQELMDQWDRRTGRSRNRLVDIGPLSANRRAHIGAVMRNPSSPTKIERREPGGPITDDHREKISKGIRRHYAKKQK